MSLKPQVAPLPKIIWMLWLQGWEQAPRIVQACLATWRKHNPGWTIQTLTAANLHQFLDPAVLASAQGKEIEPEALSDIIRLALLERYGGVWADSTTYCLRPLDTWLPDSIFSSGFFAFARPGPDRMLSSWFLAASKGSVIIQQWHGRAQHYWQERDRRDHYFWVHYLFEECYNADDHFRALWELTPTISADRPHYFAPYHKEFSQPVTADDRQLVESAALPLLKLTHKINPGEYSDDSVFSYLCDRALERSGKSLTSASEPTAHAPPARRPRQLLVTWYGSFNGHGTIGDLLALQSVTSHLVGRGHQVLYASAADLNIPGAKRVDLYELGPEQLGALIFVCGPIIKGHTQTHQLFERFGTCRKLAVGVSLFPQGHSQRVNPFDQVLAREGGDESCEDVAILAPHMVAYQSRLVPQGAVSIGVVLRGSQFEYGAHLCLWERTEELALQVADAIIAERGGQIIKIENHLQRSGLAPAKIEAQYAHCDLIISSRFHGAIMAARHGVPWIALDQIVGGAKVSGLLGGSGWPHVFKSESADPVQLLGIARQLLAGDFRSRLLEMRDQTILKANLTLARLDRLLE